MEKIGIILFAGGLCLYLLLQVVGFVAALSIRKKHREPGKGFLILLLALVVVSIAAMFAGIVLWVYAMHSWKVLCICVGAGMLGYFTGRGNRY